MNYIYGESPDLILKFDFPNSSADWEIEIPIVPVIPNPEPIEVSIDWGDDKKTIAKITFKNGTIFCTTTEIYEDSNITTDSSLNPLGGVCYISHKYTKPNTNSEDTKNNFFYVSINSSGPYGICNKNYVNNNGFNDLVEIVDWGATPLYVLHYGFSGATKLKKIPNSVFSQNTIIATYCFSGCTNLKTLPEGFSLNENLKNISYMFEKTRIREFI